MITDSVVSIFMAPIVSPGGSELGCKVTWHRRRSKFSSFHLGFLVKSMGLSVLIVVVTCGFRNTLDRGVPIHSDALVLGQPLCGLPLGLLVALLFFGGCIVCPGCGLMARQRAPGDADKCQDLDCSLHWQLYRRSRPSLSRRAG